MELGRLAPSGEMAVIWIGPKIGVLRHKTAKVIAYRCPDCGMIQLESKPDQK
jgi:predicted RNA-binding Zn-ribbon protein involved in translation (DUF1610 family)